MWEGRDHSNSEKHIEEGEINETKMIYVNTNTLGL